MTIFFPPCNIFPVFGHVCGGLRGGVSGSQRASACFASAVSAGRPRGRSQPRCLVLTLNIPFGWKGPCHRLQGAVARPDPPQDASRRPSLPPVLGEKSARQGYTLAPVFEAQWGFKYK